MKKQKIREMKAKIRYYFIDVVRMSSSSNVTGIERHAIQCSEQTCERMCFILEEKYGHGHYCRVTEITATEFRLYLKNK